MTATDRLQSEMRFHDEQARQRAHFFALHPERLIFADDEYLEHESWIRPAFEALLPLQGCRVLDLGCGHGMAAVVMARAGARVVACDLSLGYLAEARLRAVANEVNISWVHADGQNLPFADASFDRIWGNAVVHHLDLRHAAAEIQRLLAPGGRAVFCEPWDGNPLLRIARRFAASNRHTRHEKPLSAKDLAFLRSAFPNLCVIPQQLLGMGQRFGLAGKRLREWDARLLRWFPALGRFCRYVTIVLQRDETCLDHPAKNKPSNDP